MHIYGPSHLHGPQGINAPHGHRSVPSGPSRVSGDTSDQLELSDAGRIAARLSDVPEIRHERVAEIRQAIAEGTYETDEKLSVALNGLLDEIG